MPTSVREHERGMWDRGEPERMPKSGLFAVCLVNHTPALRTYFSLKYRLQTNSVWLFTKHSPHERMLFAVPRLHVYTNIFLISACLIPHSCTDVDAALYFVLTHAFPMPFISVCIADFILHVHEQLRSHLADIQSTDVPPLADQQCHLFRCIISPCERQTDN